MMLVLLLIVSVSGYQPEEAGNGMEEATRVCEPISVSFCNQQNMKYNMTSMPNHVGHMDQMEATKVINDFIPLVKVQCSALVKASCLPIMNRFNLDWPETLNCSGFPTEDKLCMKPPEHLDIELPKPNPKVPEGKDFKKLIEKLMESTGKNRFNKKSTNKPAQKDRGLKRKCNKDILYRKQDKDFMGIWMLALAVMCFVSTLATVLTFTMDTTRFPYPQRPIIFLSFCYCVYSMAYIIRAIVGPKQMSCGKTGEFLIESGEDQRNPWAIASFLLLYYFGMASAIWFVMLSFCWFISAARGWVEETLAKYATLFHLMAWGVPTIQVIAILITKKMSANELDGMCYVGTDGNDMGALTGFVLVPLAVTLILGSLLTLMGFYFLFSIRNNLARTTTTNITRLEKLMMKIGVFTVLYAVPTTCVVGCLFYERFSAEEWVLKASQLRRVCEDCPLRESIPPFPVFVVKVFMLLAPGITCLMWICSGKTLQTWSNCFCNRFNRRKNQQAAYEYYQSAYLHERGLASQQAALIQSVASARPGGRDRAQYL